MNTAFVINDTELLCADPAPKTSLDKAAACSSDATLALDAFDRGVALVDLTHRTLRWCSPAFQAHCCVAAEDTLASLEQHLPGVQIALGKLGRADALRGDVTTRVIQWCSAAGGIEVQATAVAPGIAALRLLDGDGHTMERERATRRHLEDREKLLFTSRALSVGEMASTLAHELNQPIGTVTNVLRGIRTRLERKNAGHTDAVSSPAALIQGVQLALDQSLFAARIIARIREYTHSRQPRREPLDLAHVVRESLALLDWEILRDGVSVDIDLTPIPCPVMGDEVMLQQLFVNLLRNALEAMRENAANSDTPLARNLSLRLSVERDRREAVLALRDNGCGLPQDAHQRLFVPFQSTKPNGMGIGLNICRSFVELHQGRLWFSANGDGTEADTARGCTFHVALPLACEAASTTNKV